MADLRCYEAKAIKQHRWLPVVEFVKNHFFVQAESGVVRSKFNFFLGRHWFFCLIAAESRSHKLLARFMTDRGCPLNHWEQNERLFCFNLLFSCTIVFSVLPKAFSDLNVLPILRDAPILVREIVQLSQARERRKNNARR
jgi:hypothetical protein